MSAVKPDTPPLLVPRTFSPLREGSERELPQPLSCHFRESVLVVLGDPGAGKTEAFKKAAEEEDGGLYLPVRTFLIRSPEIYRGHVLYLDALDEIRARHADGGTALEEVLRRLDQIGVPKFRLSCREADWFGGLDAGTVKEFSPDGKITVLRLEPLTEEDIAVIAAQTLDDPEDFINQAKARGVFEWLKNPQSLGLILKVVGRGNWPETKTELYERACGLLAQESNEVHSRTGKGQIAEDAVLEAAGYLCAVYLCGGTAGFALTGPASDDDDFPYIGVMGNDNRPALDAAGRRKLFRSEGPERIVPVHRTLAEFLAARYLVGLVRECLPIGRVLSLLTGSDLGVLSEMRGLFAWLACLCSKHSSFLLGRDPLGVVLYGDPAALSGSEKVQLFEELVALAQRDPWFRSEDWTGAPFGALTIPELRPAFRRILEDSSQPVQLADCVLNALAHGQSMPEFGGLLLAIVRDPQRPSILREDALAAYRNSCPNQVEPLLGTLKDVQEGRLSDSKDHLRGYLLETLFPEFIDLRDVLAYLVEGEANYFGGYWKFLHSGLFDRTGEARLPELLDILAEEVQAHRIEARGRRYRDFVGQALLRSLKNLGAKVPIPQIYGWLGVPLLPSGSSILGQDQIAQLKKWLANHPDIVRGLFLHWLAVTPVDELRGKRIDFWYYRCPAPYPPGFGSLLLELVSQKEDERVRRFLFGRAVSLCFYEMDPEAPSIEELFASAKSDAGLMHVYLEGASCSIEEHLKIARMNLENRRREEEQRRRNIEELLSRVEGIRDGTDSEALIFLSGLFMNGEAKVEKGEKAGQQIERQFGVQIADAARLGFFALLRESSLLGYGPFELGILESEGKGRRISVAILAGMDGLWSESQKELLELPRETIARALIHQITDRRSLNSDWSKAVLVQQPSIAAQALVEFWSALLERGSLDPPGLYMLWFNETMGEVAGDIALRLLVDFPGVEPQVLGQLLWAGLLRGDSRTLLQLAREKLAKPRALGTKRRTQWLTTAFLLEPEVFIAPLKKCVSRDAGMLEYAAGFISNLTEASPDFLKRSQLVEGLMQIFGEVSSPIEHESRRGDFLRMSNIVTRWLSLLGSDLSQDAHDRLSRLREDRKLAAWYPTISYMLALQARKRREAEFSYPSVEHIVQTFRNESPANAADLQALVCDHLKALANEIRNGASDPYKAFWNIDSRERPTKPRPENDCRNRLLGSLRPRLMPKVWPESEGTYADQKRSDIKFVSGTVNVPAEVKAHTHRELWTAISNQLIPRYMRDPGAGKRGIFIGFWFGVEVGPTPKPPAGITPPQNAEQLRLALLETIPAEHQGHVEVIVFDVSRRENPRKKVQAAKRSKKATGSACSGATNAHSAHRSRK